MHNNHLIMPYIFHLLRRPDDFITSKKQKYGSNVGVYRTYLFGSPSIIVCSPSLCKLVLHSTDKFKQDWPTAQALGANSVITIDEPRHATIKTFILNAINRPDSLARFVNQSQPNIIAALESWSLKGKIRAMDELKKTVLIYMGRYAAHLDLKQDNIDDIEKTFSGILEGFRTQPWNFPGTPYYRALKCRKKITNILKEELEKRNRNANSTQAETHDDLMDGLMQMKDKEGNSLRDEEVLDNVLSSIHMGYLSISYVVAWSLHFLAKSPYVLQKLREENMAMREEKNGGPITYEDILKLTYTNKVVEETIRLGNTSSFSFRKATEDIEWKGYLIPKGWQVILWIRYLHTDPTNFIDPLCFNPDRWDTRPKYGTYLAFGAGPRACPGNMLARVNLAMFLHHLSVGYKWELLNPNTKINYLSHAHPADGVEISFRKI